MESTVQAASKAIPVLTISIVTFNPDINEFRSTLAALADALTTFDPTSVAITVIDNSRQDSISAILEEQLPSWQKRLIHGQGNVGFGQGHNLALSDMGEFHLILNPDVQMNHLALRNAIEFMQKHSDCGLLSPRAFWPDGKRQYLCKRYPAVFDLLLRGFAPKGIQRFFDNRLQRYEMRAETQIDIFWNPPIVSGCFMLFRSDVLINMGGFDPGYFLYFEDFDLSLRTSCITKIAYVPNVEIVHTGGHAAKKGHWHIRQFFRSCLKFYWVHGFRLI
ncbi:glycosyltransferase [Brucella anthropi]|uniref:Glycosyltransferase n=1 Tax=Brucella anthropi TaxID=529 RepID=A0A6L3Z6R6_BRUAN|nr:glycosyltransferase [Brucella anthropi]KAB2730345.1 glycosyltransferase [Brucella anthropi]KAB2770933.1 glycosyltransferase [Brucella anthropi]